MEGLDDTIDPALLEFDIDALCVFGDEPGASNLPRIEYTTDILQDEINSGHPCISSEPFDIGSNVQRKCIEQPASGDDAVKQASIPTHTAWPLCPSDPLIRYRRLLAQLTADNGRVGELQFFLRHEWVIREIYCSGHAYAAALCKVLSRLDATIDFDVVLSCTIAHGPEWLWKTPGYPAQLGRDIELRDDKAQFRTLLDRFEATVEMLSDLRMHCILMSGLDVGEQPTEVPVANRETSDSCDSDDYDNEAIYEITRSSLDKFHQDPLKKWMQVDHHYNRRLRRDIRAWARLARYGCMKLSGGTMLVHKHRSKVPRRPRKKLVRYVLPLMPSYKPRAQLHPNDIPFSNESFSSGESSAGSGGSPDSVSSGQKRKRLPTREEGYPCFVCDKTFDRACDLAHHQRSHQDNESRPYGCERCDRRFTFPKDLRRHERRVHRSDSLTSEDHSA